MNPLLRIKITRIVQKTLDKILLKQFPELNTRKIAEFWMKGTEKILEFTSAIILVTTFAWYFPVYRGIPTNSVIIIILCLILLATHKKNE